MKSVGQESIELEWDLLTAVADRFAGLGHLMLIQGKTTSLAHWRLNDLNRLQAIDAQPGAWAMTGHTMRWEQKIDDCSLGPIKPHRTG